MLILFAAAVVYLLLRPTLSGWLGVNLPGLFPEEQVAVNDPPPERTDRPETGSTPVIPDSELRPPAPANSDEPNAEVTVTDVPKTNSNTPSVAKTTTTPKTPTPPRSSAAADSTSTPPTSPNIAKTTPATRPAATATSTPGESPRSSTPPPRDPPPLKPKPTPNTSAKPPPNTQRNAPAAETKLGQLTDLGRGRMRSTAGLIYVQERSEHRVDHVLRHGKDDPSRPVHGVFNGDREVILAVIDEAWQFAQQGKPPKVQVEEEGNRSVYIIDLGRKIGFMGGQAGKRRNFPPCKHLQLVVEGDEVITAYPTIPR
jgi:hypothetical protein